MGINKNHIDFIITRFLAGEATRSEVLQLEQWMSNSESNKKYFEGIRFVHDQAIASHVIEKFDVDAAWSNLRTNMHASKPEKAGVLILNRSVLLRVAAIFIVFVSISLLVY